MPRVSVSVIIPVYNGASVLGNVLASLEKQKYPIERVFIVDDASTDSSQKKIRHFKQYSKLHLTIILHKKNTGLAACYNSALRKIKTPYVITLMQDCVIHDKDGVKKLLVPFGQHAGIVESCSKMLTSRKTWQEYNFWLKCFFSRRVGKILSGRNGSFCCFSTEAVRNAGLFDDTSFRVAGEDVDIMQRIEKIGNIVDVETIVEHVHSKDPNFSLYDLVHKQNQHAEAGGATLTQTRPFNIVNIGILFLRPLLIVGLFLPGIKVYVLFLVIFYSIFFTINVYLSEWKNPKILILPFVNTFLLFSCSYYFLKGLITQKQTL